MIAEKSKKVTLLIDGHVHVYPHYNLKSVLQNGISNLTLAARKSSAFNAKITENYSDDVFPVWFLAERSDCNFFEDAIKMKKKVENNGFRMIPSDETETLIVEKAGKPILYILAGRQIVTKEGLEILSIASNLFQKDREKTIDDVISSIVDANGVPTLNWAPGKWFFNRGKAVKRLLEEKSPENLLICDTSLRPTVWPTPRQMATAIKRGVKVIAGSDPLPFYDEEKYIGSYGFCLTGEFNHQRPAFSIRSLLRKPDKNIFLIGKRNDIITFCQRIYKILMEQRR